MAQQSGLVLADEADLFIFLSLRAAEAFLEGWMISEGGDSAYDFSGRLFRIARHPRTFSGLTVGPTVRIEAVDTEPLHVEGLRSLLIAKLRPHTDEELDHLDLASLLERAIARFGFAA